MCLLRCILWSLWSVFIAPHLMIAVLIRVQLEWFTELFQRIRE